ncbi:dystrotelin isoform X2 [Brienomyrus brachyistius]|uniref:dystrotelin isoform X2 n=1 Tax=Brienomyrus brachyistius TaxID=42636 RepID=UPI0020B1D307|nr:dystrotelin isoform X2 [Brienomyrus brachyistius]
MAGIRVVLLRNLLPAENLDDVQPAVYRAAFKIRSLQKLCQTHAVRIRSLRPAMQSLGRAVAPGDIVTKGDVESCLQRLFDCVDQELPGQARPGAAEHTVRLLFKLFDREQTGAVFLHSVEAVMIALSGDILSAKHAALFELAVRCSELPGRRSGVMTQSGLRVMLFDLSQVPGAVQESRVFGQVESAVTSCFHRVFGAGASETQFSLWLRSDPRLLLWLSALDRISLGEAIAHPVRCHVCKASPVVGLRYRCLQCLNLHLCQTCFVSQRGTSKHRPFHVVQVHSTQPTLKEALFSLVHRVQQTLRRRRPARMEVESSTLTGAQLRAHASTLQARSAVEEQRLESESRDSHPTMESKAMQTDPVPVLQSQGKASLLRGDLSHTRGLLQDPQREQRRAHSFVCSLSSWQVEPGSALHLQLIRQLEKQLQVGRACVQAENSWLKEKCNQLEVTTEILAQHNQNLQEELHQVRQVLETLTRNEKKCARENKQWKPEEKTDQTRRQEGGRSTPEGSQQPPEMTLADRPGKGPGCTTVMERLQPESQETGDRGGSTNRFLDSVELEEQLFDVVQHLKQELSQDPETASPAPASDPRGDLLEAAENVGNSISRLVSAISLTGPVHSPCPGTSALHFRSDL